MKPQPHSWMPYLYKYKADNDNYRMWIRDSHRIYETETGEYLTANNMEWKDSVFKSFDEADKSFANDENRNAKPDSISS